MADVERIPMERGLSVRTLQKKELAVRLSVPGIAEIRPAGKENQLRLVVVLDKDGLPDRMAIERDE